MGFFKSFKTEFGKKTGKALGNKMYGAYADDKRIGVNRGKLKGESDGVKITSEIRQSEVALEREQTKYEREQLKYEREQAEYERKQAEYEREQVEYEKEQKQLADVLSIKLNPKNKAALIESLTNLSVFVDKGMRENSADEYLIAAKSKFDTGVAMLQAVDPSNPMAYFFLQKKTEWEKAKKKRKTELWILVGVCIALFIGLFIYLYVSGELTKESPLEKLINKYL
jgi:hypothetical protein